jgi:hypothetical protein
VAGDANVVAVGPGDDGRGGADVPSAGADQAGVLQDERDRKADRRHRWIAATDMAHMLGGNWARRDNTYVDRMAELEPRWRGEDGR